MSDCERRWELDAHREGRLGTKDARSFERHLKVCSECKLRSQRDERLRMLGASLSDDPPSELTLRRLRMRILRDVATGAHARRPVPWTRVALAAGLALAVVGGAGWYARERRVPVAVASSAPVPTVTSATLAEAPAGTVTPAAPDARWTQVRRDGLETVTLDDGMLAIHVRPQRPGERFLVSLPDGELEVRGTTFDVSVAGGATRRVHVDEGLVELRLRGQTALRLGVGQAWNAAATPRTIAPRTRAPAASLQVPADDGATAYAGALDLLRSGRCEEAAAAFHAFLLAHPAAPQAEDASFLEAVALARAGRVDAAALVAEHQLASYPASFHRKEAAILVARAASQRGDCAHARAVLASWAAAPDAEVRSALGSCAQP